MAELHVNLKPLRRANGRGALKMAAYQSGQALMHDGQTHSRSGRKLQEVRGSELLLSEGAPAWMQDRQRLWGTVETMADKSTRPRNAITGLWVTVPFPRALTWEQRETLARAFVREVYVSKGMVADIAYHESKASDGGTNPHMHVVLSTRKAGPDGFGKVEVSWRRHGYFRLINESREAWQRLCNEALESAGSSERVDVRSFKERGLDKEPTKHLGSKQWYREQHGVATPTGDHNRGVQRRNAMRALLKGYSGSSMQVTHDVATKGRKGRGLHDGSISRLGRREDNDLGR